MNRIRTFTLGLAALALTGCATLTNDAMQQIEFIAPQCATTIPCNATNKRGRWQFYAPATVPIRRSDDLLVVRCRTNRGIHTQSVKSRSDAKIVASAVFIDLGITDAITDKHREYPQQVIISACIQQ